MKDGGLAFPGKRYEMLKIAGKDEKEEISVTHSGMSLRDWFAGMALQGLIASMSTEYACKNLTEEMEYNRDPKRRPEWTVARSAYHYADAMIAERTKEDRVKADELSHITAQIVAESARQNVVMAKALTRMDRIMAEYKDDIEEAKEVYDG